MKHEYCVWWRLPLYLFSDRLKSHFHWWLNERIHIFSHNGHHSLRHLIGGKKDCVSQAAGGELPYKCVSCLNRKHMLFAWLSLFWVGFSDFYVRMCSMGVFTDWRIL